MSKQIATAESFRQRALDKNYGPEEELTLPSGQTVIARKPTALWWIIQRGILPSRLAAVAAGRADTLPSEMTIDEKIEAERFLVTVLESVVVEPKIRVNPGPGEVDRFCVDADDQVAILKFAGGETEADGQSLDTFRGQSGPSDSGSGGEPVVH